MNELNGVGIQWNTMVFGVFLMVRSARPFFATRPGPVPFMFLLLVHNFNNESSGDSHYSSGMLAHAHILQLMWERNGRSWKCIFFAEVQVRLEVLKDKNNFCI